ncbi:MAG: Transcription elongation factor GreA [Firmicutes bacterium ADurb.Bin248]|nr:MAG: Transcription elongation factor GreA [Firmicutes bacterium ADurb.Bin248]HOG00311.1 transcription elongation factor GreA [Clostridia bacterium]HPK16327.1 transcription elongation factor GreA [Clostridia bacterium]
MGQVHLTAEGVKKYEEKLEYLKTTARTEITEQIKLARAFGDLSENAEYDAAKTEQARIESEIAEIEAMLKNVMLIDEDSISTSLVDVGATVRVRLLSKGDKVVSYQLVGSAEADPYQNRISNESPVGKALLGHVRGDIIEVTTPGGINRIEILEIGK